MTTPSTGPTAPATAEPPAIDGAAIGLALATYRDAAPLVQCLTNIVVANATANLVLASGASPAMVDNEQEAGLFAGVASGVLVNLGTPNSLTAKAMTAAVTGCRDAGTPWVLDPVAAGGLPWRTGLALDLLALHPPTIIRGNASEIAGLAGGAGGKGVDATDDPAGVLDTARELAGRFGCVVAVSGAIDHLTDGERLLKIANGDPIMTRVTGVGCALGALMAGFAGVVDDPLLAAAAATGLLTVAADRAVHTAGLPGSFAVALVDQVASVQPAELGGSIRLV